MGSWVAENKFHSKATTGYYQEDAELEHRHPDIISQTLFENYRMPEVVIKGRRIGPAHPAFIIAEAGINHNGKVERALEMVLAAKQAGADAIKFQTFKADEFVGDPNQTYTYRSQGREITESMLAMFRRYELPREAWFAIKAECDQRDIIFMSTPQNRSDLDLLLEVGIPAIKIGSDDFTNLPMLRSFANEELPLILSCGMADMADVYRSLEVVGALDGRPTVLLLCTSQYPTPPADVNLRKLTTLQAAFPMLTLGFSDHTIGPLASSLAAALGACVFEKHFTMDKNLPGPDHWFSEGPDDLAAWVASIHTAKAMLGEAVLRPTKAETAMRRIARRSVVAVRNVARGELLTESNIALRRPSTGLPPEMFEQALGKTASRDILAGEPLHLGDFVK
jgi:N,N'-diacetyllegionaminate synthase